jgi:hypothetical protein
MFHLGELLALSTNITLGCKGLTETNALAYSNNTFLSVIYNQARVFVTLDWKSLSMTNTLAYYEKP